VITFDDGFADNLEACGILRKYGVPATIYVATGAVDSGEPLWFVAVYRAFEHATQTEVALPWGGTVLPMTTRAQRDRASASAVAALKKMSAEERARAVRELLSALDTDATSMVDPHDRMLSWSEIRELASDHLFTIGAHTVTHQILSATSAEGAAREIEQSTADLVRLGGVRPTTFAYPNGKAGDYLPHHKALLKAFGYASACITEPGVNGADSDLFALRREPFYGGGPLRTFVLRMAGMNEIRARLRRMLATSARRAAAVSRAHRSRQATLGGRV
jgi:peptidoglycan/xylan/chitin deacetylase (PgdA/CDA1 family)